MSVDRCPDCGFQMAQDHEACEDHLDCVVTCQRCGGELLREGETAPVAAPVFIEEDPFDLLDEDELDELLEEE